MKTITLQFTVADDVETTIIDGHQLDTPRVREFLSAIPGDGYSYVRQLTEKDITDQANGIAERAYHETVKGFVDDLRSEIKDGNIADADGAREYLEQSIDGCHDVIYTHAAKSVLQHSRNEDAMADELGAESLVRDGNINWSGMAYMALLADVMEEIGDMNDLFTDDDDDNDDDNDDSNTGTEVTEGE